MADYYNHIRSVLDGINITNHWSNGLVVVFQMLNDLLLPVGLARWVWPGQTPVGYRYPLNDRTDIN